MPKKTFEVEIQVRGYELDGYGHVNHAVYLNYAEYARWRMIESSGAGNYFADRKISPVIGHAEITYKAPLFLAEHFIVQTELIEKRTRAAKFCQTMKRKSDQKTVAQVTVTLLVVDSNGRAVSLPDDFSKYFGEV